MNRRQRGALADTSLAAGATLLLLYSTASARGPFPFFPVLALAVGIVLVVVGIALLWGTPRPTLRARMLPSVAGLFIGFGAGLGRTTGGFVSVLCGALLLLGLWRALARA